MLSRILKKFGFYFKKIMIAKPKSKPSKIIFENFPKKLTGKNKYKVKNIVEEPPLSLRMRP